MIRFRRKALVCLFFNIFFGFSGGENDASNVMKITGGYSGYQWPRSILTYNTKQEQADEDFVEQSFIPYDLQIVADALLTLNHSQCSRDAMTVMEAINRRERWALQMFDASSKFPVGLLHGDFYQLGNFDECVSLKQPSTEESPIQGQYCLADVELFNKESDGVVQTLKPKPRDAFNSTMHWSICVPSSCTPAEVEGVIKELFALATGHQMVVRLSRDRCHVSKPQPFTKLEIVYGCFVGVFVAFTLLATAFHFYVIEAKKKSSNYNIESVREPRGNRLKEAVLCFSLIRTVGKFLQTKSSSLNLECIGGIKFLSMYFIIAGHTFLFMVGGPVENTEFYEQESRSLLNAVFVNSPLLVDTFLLISGFLMCYLLLIELDKRKGKLNIFLLYIARYMRLTPSYLVVIGLYCTFFLRMADGPLWDSRVKEEQERCIKSWWTNILYINNYVNTDDMCMFQSWYLATDYHLFIIAPFIIYPLWKWHKIGKITLGVGILISVVTPFIITVKDKLDPTLMIYAPEVYDLSKNVYFKTAYIKTHMRAGSYFFGLFVGYILYKLQTKGIKIPKYVIWFGWLISSVCGVLSMYSVIIFYHPHHQHNVFEAAVYASLHRVGWCIFTGWVLTVCITNNATLVNKFLSWKPFIPLSRLTYCAYLINGFIEIYSMGTLRKGTYMSKFELGNKSAAHAILTFIAAFLLCILFESPIHGLEKIVLGKGHRKDNEHKSSDSDQVNNNATQC